MFYSYIVTYRVDYLGKQVSMIVDVNIPPHIISSSDIIKSIERRSGLKRTSINQLSYRFVAR